MLRTSAHGLTPAWMSLKYAFYRDITAIKPGIPPDDAKGTGKKYIVKEYLAVFQKVF